jgi:hypothetical protein
MRYLNYPLVTFGALFLAACGNQNSNDMLEPPAAEFSVIEECQAELTALQMQTAALTSTSVKDRTGLVGKVDNAAKALAAGKNADAVQKVTDFLDKVTTLQAQGKITAEEAAPLISGAGAAIACINALTVPA